MDISDLQLIWPTLVFDQLLNGLHFTLVNDQRNMHSPMSKFLSIRGKWETVSKRLMVLYVTAYIRKTVQTLDFVCLGIYFNMEFKPKEVYTECKSTLE